MKIVTMYEAEDGKLFKYEDDCIQHENNCANLYAANTMLQNGESVLEALKQVNGNDKQWVDCLQDEDKSILDSLSKDSKLIISHWQCSNVPGYKPCDFDLRGRVYVYGDAESWNGPYGGWVTVNELIRYARDTYTKIGEPL